LFDDARFADILGHDRAALTEDLRRVAAAAEQAAVLRPAGEDRMEIMLGRIAWPMPVPLVKAGDGWHFDSEAGIEEIIDRRIGSNELSAIEVARSFAEAERIYATEDRDGDGVLEYAQRLASTEGQQDGLYWPTLPGAEDESPLGPFVGQAAAYLTGRTTGEPYRGYHIRVLTRQGANAPGGAYDYVINGNMVAGFALLAWPALYGETGIMSFLIGPNGILLEKDLGSATSEQASALDSFNPDAAWGPTED
jgi:hypothetical protein